MVVTQTHTSLKMHFWTSSGVTSTSSIYDICFMYCSCVSGCKMYFITYYIIRRPLSNNLTLLFDDNRRFWTTTSRCLHHWLWTLLLASIPSTTSAALFSTLETSKLYVWNFQIQTLPVHMIPVEPAFCIQPVLIQFDILVVSGPWKISENPWSISRWLIPNFQNTNKQFAALLQL